MSGQGHAPAGETRLLDFGQILATLADPVVVADVGSRIVYANQAAERLLGWSEGTLAGHPLSVMQPYRLREAHNVGFHRYVQTRNSTLFGHALTLPARRYDGSEIPIELTLSSATVAGNLFVVAAFHDPRPRIELERQQSLTRYLQASTRAAARLSSLLDFDRVLEVVVETLVQDFDALLARIWLAEPTSKTLYLRAQSGTAIPPAQANFEALHYEALPLWLDQVARTRRPFVREDIVDDGRFDQQWAVREGITTVAAFPLLIGDTLHGIMVLFRGQAIAPELVEVLSSFAAIVSASLNDVQLFVREQEARSEAEEAQRHFAFLAEASRVLASSLDYETTLRSVARLAVPELADWCVVDLTDSDGPSRRLAIARGDLSDDRGGEATSPDVIFDQATEECIRRVLDSGRSELLPHHPATAANSAGDAGRIPASSSMYVPLVAHHRIRGVMTFLSADPGQHFCSADLQLAEDLAHRAAIAVDNALLYRDLQSAIEMRDDFLGSVSHDLKNPIAAIKGRAQMLLRRIDELPIEERERYAQGLQSIDAGAAKMNRFINDLVDVARLRTGQPLDLDSGGADLIALVRHIAGEQQQGPEPPLLQIESDLDSLTGEWDASRLERVIANLLSNAIKYSPPGAAITIRVRSENRAESPVAILEVCDRGIGIPAADVPHVFERFHRAANVIGRVEGSGIGLAGAKQIVEQHGGTIAVVSQEGEGSTFTVTLPLSRSDPA